jgi:hypothetical protein
VGQVRGDRAELGKKEDMRWRRSPAMTQRRTRGRKLTDDDTKEEAGVTRCP